MKSAWVPFLAGVFALVSVAIVLSMDGSPDRGKDVYATQKCTLCHSISGVGGKKLALDGVGSKLKLEDMKKWIRTPKEMKADTTMKPYPNLPEKDLADLTAYLMTLK